MSGIENFDLESVEEVQDYEDIGEKVEIPEHLIRASELDDRLPEQRIEAYGDDARNYEKAGTGVSVPTDDGTTGQLDDDDQDYSYLEP